MVMTTDMQKNIDNLLKLYFEVPKVLYNHLFSSFHKFIDEMIPYYLINEQNYFHSSMDNEIIYLHGFKFSNIRIKPPTFDNDNEIKFPSDARKNQLNYSGTIIADIQQFVEKMDTISGEKVIINVDDVEKEIQIANIPIMVKSKYCSTHIKQNLKGECKYDPGGYFIVGGSEKVVLSIEKPADNKILIYAKKDASYRDGMTYVAQINSKRNDWSDNLQILTIKNRKDGVLVVSTSSQLVDIPLFVLLRALGIESDQSILNYITYDIEDNEMLNLLRPSVANSVDDEGNMINSKEEAMEYLMSKLKRSKRISQTDEEVAKIQKRIYLDKILTQDLLPHLGEDLTKKIVFLGFMAHKLLNVLLKRSSPDDRDALQNKRIEQPGDLLGQLFRQNWKKLLNEIGKHFKKKNQNDESPINVINQIKPSIIEQGLKKALSTGTWGMNKSKKGVAQTLNRLTWVQSVSYLRRIITPSMDDSSGKIISIRFVNNNQYQMLCSVETPEGQKIGVVKHLAMTSTITNQNATQADVLKTLIKESDSIIHPYDIDPLTMNDWVKIMVNGNWQYVCKMSYANEFYNFLKKKRRENIIDKYTTILFDYTNKEIRIHYEAGRLIRPVLIVNNNKLNITSDVIKDIESELRQKDKSQSWKKIINKYPNLVEYEDIESLNHNMVAQKENKLREMIDNMERKLEYDDSIKINRHGNNKWVNYTHCDFHPWTLLGSTIVNVPFSNHNYAARNIIHFSQAKQAIGTYLTSYKDRMDISQILYHPHVPLVTTRGMMVNGSYELPYGEPAIVAVCSYNGLTIQPKS